MFVRYFKFCSKYLERIFTNGFKVARYLPRLCHYKITSVEFVGAISMLYSDYKIHLSLYHNGAKCTEKSCTAAAGKPYWPMA